MLEIPKAIEDAFPPDQDALFRIVAQKLNDEMLLDIARADAGYDVEKNFRRLKKIVQAGVMPRRLRWNPGEVLALERWSEPEHPDWSPTTGHIKRLFASASLMQFNSYYDDDYDESDSLFQAVGSAIALGEEMITALARFITFRLQRQLEEPCYSWFYSMALIQLIRELDIDHKPALLECSARLLEDSKSASAGVRYSMKEAGWRHWARMES